MIWISLALPLPLAACPGLQAHLFRYTPRLTMLAPQLMALDLIGSLRLFGGPRKLWHRIMQTCPPGTRAGMAPTAWGAALLARQDRGPRRALRRRSMQRYLDRLPCSALELAPTASALLDDWGCGTLGQLRRLPRAGLAQRGLATALEQLDRAYHAGSPAAAWVPAPMGFEASREPEFRGTSLAAIETALTPLLTDLCRYLQAHQAATDQMEWTLLHDPTRSPTPETRLTLSFSRPQWDLQACLRLSRLRIQSLNLPGPVHRVTLRCLHIQTRQPLPASLLPDSQVDQQREERLLDVLKARLGTACLHFSRLRDWPLPEHAEAWFSRPQRARPSWPPTHAHWPDSRPFWLLETPTPLETTQDRPAWRGVPLRLLSGPERIEEGWWRSRNTSREYFVATDARAIRYWIYQDLRSGGWFLHGLFA
jgi:protein ImuB